MQNSTQFDPLDQSSLIDPRAYGLIKASYSINEALDVLSIGRTSLYYAIKRGDLRPAKLGKKTLLLANDLAKFLSNLQLAASSDRADTAVSSAKLARRWQEFGTATTSEQQVGLK